MVLTRSCPCGYEESKPVAEEGDDALVGTMTNTVGTTTIVLICVGAAVIVAAVVAMIVISNKRKSKK
jgi:hypothetical protein